MLDELLGRWVHQASIELDDATGEILSYIGPRVPDMPAGPCISQADAVAKANSVLQAAGITDVDPTPYANPPQEASFMSPDGGQTVLPSMLGHEWVIAYTRMFGQIPFDDQTVDVTLQAETGVLNVLSVHYRSPVPTSGTIALSGEQAASLAWNHINSTTIQNAVLQNVSLFAVQPNGFFTAPNHSEEALPGPAKIAYRCKFVYQGMDSPRHIVDADGLISEPEDWLNFGQSETNIAVFVDAQDGSIIGGWLSQPRGLKAALSATIANAREVQVVAKNKRGEWMDKKPVALLSEAANTKMFHQVKTLQSFAPHKPIKKEKQAAVLKVVLVDKAGGAKQEIFYMSTGKIGKPSAEVTLPPALKAWLQSLPKIAPQEVATVSVSRK